MPLTANHVQNALKAVGALGNQIKSTAELASGANAALAQAPSGLTQEGAAAFLATMAQESAYFRTTTEYGSSRKRYDPYRGRTFEQVTWKENYATFGAWCKAKGLLSDANYFVTNPTRLADYQWAWLGGVWYFEYAKLWRYANAGNFLAVSQGVNGGTGRIGSSFIPGGWDHRNKMYKAFLLVGGALLPDGRASKPPEPSSGKLAADGSFGPATIKALQEVIGVTQDGSFGPKTISAWQRRMGTPVDGKISEPSSLINKAQRWLNRTDFNIPGTLRVDGLFGPATITALQHYLNRNGSFTGAAKWKG